MSTKRVAVVTGASSGKVFGAQQLVPFILPFMDSRDRTSDCDRSVQGWLVPGSIRQAS